MCMRKLYAGLLRLSQPISALAFFSAPTLRELSNTKPHLVTRKPSRLDYWIHYRTYHREPTFSSLWAPNDVRLRGCAAAQCFCRHLGPRSIRSDNPFLAFFFIQPPAPQYACSSPCMILPSVRVLRNIQTS
jgi:hypothetical protein